MKKISKSNNISQQKAMHNQILKKELLKKRLQKVEKMQNYKEYLKQKRFCRIMESTLLSIVIRKKFLIKKQMTEK